MTRLVRKAALLGACGLFIASVAGAAVPDPAHSTVPAYIFAGGVETTSNPTPDPGIPTTIIVRDFLNNPIVGSNVELNYSACTDTKICTAVVAGRTVDPVSHTIRTQTGVGGSVTLIVMGAAANPGTLPDLPFVGAGCIKIYADGIQLGAATSVLLDQNGATGAPTYPNMGVHGDDFAIVFGDIGWSQTHGNVYIGRADYSKDGLINGTDAAFYYPHLARAASLLGSQGGCRQSPDTNPATNPRPYWP